MQFGTFKVLLRDGLEGLVETVREYYTSFAEGLSLSLEKNGVEDDFDGIRWSCQPLEPTTRESLDKSLGEIKGEYPDVVDMFLFRAPRESLPHESRKEGLLFAGLQDGRISPENVRDIGLYVSTLDIQKREKQTNGDITG